MHDFYRKVVNDLIRKGLLNKKMRLLVACGGEADVNNLEPFRFDNMSVSNIDAGTGSDRFYQDVEDLEIQDGSYDFCIVHDGLHHCRSPHRALLELYRVARVGVLFFEPHDSFLTRLGVRFNIGQEYEHAAVFYNDFAKGGVRNTEIPNFVFRWSARQVRQTIQSHAPHASHRFFFYYDMRIPEMQLEGRKNRLFPWAIKLAKPFLELFFRIFPKQCNHFACAIFKPRLPQDLHPWLVLRDGRIEPNRSWFSGIYKDKD